MLLTQLSEDLDEFINHFLDQDIVVFSREQAIHVIHNIQIPYKYTLRWQTRGDISFLLPQDITPTPCLKLDYANNILTPTLSYLYDKEPVEVNDTRDLIIDKETGSTIKRLFDMEVTYQQDLMTLYSLKIQFSFVIQFFLFHLQFH